MSKIEQDITQWLTVIIYVAIIGLAIEICLALFVWIPAQEKEKEEIRNMSCKELQAYILHPKGFSDVAKDVYLVKCI